MSPNITFQPSGQHTELIKGETILDAAKRAGETINSTCGGQGVCGSCKVRPEPGTALPEATAEETALLSDGELAAGIRLACAAKPDGDVTVFVPEGSRPSASVVLKSAPGKGFSLDPALRNYYVELEPPQGSGTEADAERLLEGLAARYGLEGLSVAFPALRALSGVLRDGLWKVTATVRDSAEVVRLQPGYRPGVYGAAFDLGTTTIAGYLFNLVTGELISSDTILNPQIAFGEDVITRISYARAQGGEVRMREAVLAALNGLAGKLAARAGLTLYDVMEAVIAGNTVMQQLAMGIPIGAMGAYPFTPALTRLLEADAREAGLDIHPAGRVSILPVIGGFVGGDNTAALIAAGPFKQDETALLMDIGTNAELDLWSGGRLVCASCATGPAFEGAKIKFGMRAATGAIERVVIDPETFEASYRVIGSEGWSVPLKPSGARGICGSGVVDAVAGMRAAGVIDLRGAFNKVDSPRVREGEGGYEYVVAWRGETAAGTDITITQADVRAVQLAKAAISAGTKILMDRMGVDRVDRVLVAGSFGNYIDREKAAAIGMFPGCGTDRVAPVGNAAGDGASAFLLSGAKRREAVEVARLAEHVELSVDPGFQDAFLSGMDFPGGPA